ncbi:MAG: glycosyltransferase family 2 protein [Methanomassiliicoccales archaeon]
MSLGSGICAVVVNWNRPVETIECLRSLVDDRPDIRLIVVDNGSSDDSVERISGEFPGAQIIPLGSNLGYAAGANRGITRALEEDPEYVLLMNNDAFAERGMVDSLVSALREEGAGMTGPKILYTGEDRVWFAGGYFNRVWGYTRHPGMDSKVRLEKREVDFITGCAMMVRAEVFRRVGVFDERFFMYMEDLDLCLRARALGYRCLYVPEGRARHKVSASSGEGGNRMTPLRAYLYSRNMFILISKLRGPLLITRFMGQFMIRLPYYTIAIADRGFKGAMGCYWKAVLDGLIAMIGGRIRSPGMYLAYPR